MIALIAGNAQPLAQLIQARLLRTGVECPREYLVSWAAARPLLKESGCDVLFLICPESLQGSAEEIRAVRGQTRAAIVAVGSGAGPKQILEMIRAGASDYLECRGDFESDLDALVARLRAGVQKPQGGQAIGIVAASGGCGVSTLTVNLGAALARASGPCCLIDLQLRGGDLATLLNLKPRHTLVDLCFQGDRVDETMFQQTLQAHPGNMSLLAAPPILGDVSCVHAEIVAQVLQLARASFPHVVLDLEDVTHSEQARAIHDCDLVVVVARLDFPCILRTRRLLDFLRESGTPADKIRLVANRCGYRGEIPQRQAAEALGQQIFHVVPEEQSALVASINVGNPIVLESPGCKVSLAYKRLAELITSA